MHDEATTPLPKMTHHTASTRERAHDDDPPPTIRDAPSARRLAASMMLIPDASPASSCQPK